MYSNQCGLDKQNSEKTNDIISNKVKKPNKYKSIFMMHIEGDIFMYTF